MYVAKLGKLYVKEIKFDAYMNLISITLIENSRKAEIYSSIHFGKNADDKLEKFNIEFYKLIEVSVNDTTSK